ncbi:hypothetical protein ACFVXC_07075 [Streptomyces sp. NPDC058257]|uniref:hypothetical protein n=1 Tax=Streptomyces sp. NPDC058257 TaxID=3346409 RepID=UPI0036E180A7
MSADGAVNADGAVSAEGAGREGFGSVVLPVLRSFREELCTLAPMPLPPLSSRG